MAWKRQRKRHSIAARKGRRNAYRIYDFQDPERPRYVGVEYGKSEKSLARQFQSTYRKLYRKGAIDIKKVRRR